MTKKELEALTPEKLVELAEKLQKENATLTKSLKEQKELNQELGEELKDLEQSVEDKVQGVVTFKSGKHTYELLSPKFRLPGTQVLGVEDLEADKDLVEKILAKPGQGILKLKK